MKPILEAPKSRFDTSSIYAFARIEPAFAWNWHYHAEIELTWVRRGHGTRLVGDHSAPYRPHDFVLLGANLPHTWFSPTVSRRNEAIVIQFRPSAFPEPLQALPEFETFRELFHRAARGLRFSPESARCLQPRLESLVRQEGFARWISLTQILTELASESATALASPEYRHRRSYKLSSRLERVTAHIERHCREDLTLPQMARIAGLTPSAFSRFFRKMTEQTFVDYRNSCRIRVACRLLGESDLTVTEIAHECGFNNLAGFNRRFLREKQMVPRAYRRMHQPALAEA